MRFKRPGGELSTRPLEFFWIADCSGSMSVNGKIQQLNTAIRESLPAMRKVADENPFATVRVRALAFSDGARWHIQPTPVEEFKWVDLQAGGVTDMGKALSMVAEQLKMPPMSRRALPPVLVLISDGQPTDDFNRGLEELMAQPWGKKAVRIAIAIGQDADREVLQKFINNIEFQPLQANNVESLTNYIRWASTVVLQSASAPASQSKGSSVLRTNVPLPSPPPATDVDDVW